MRTKQQMAIGKVQTLNPCLHHLVEPPRDCGRRIEQQMVVVQILTIPGTNGHPAGTGDHVRELRVEPALRLTRPVAELVD